MRHRSKSRSPSLTFINNLLHSKSTYFYKWRNYTIPSVCILALLVGLYVSVNPSSINNMVNHNVEKVNAIASSSDPDSPSSGGNSSNNSSLSLIVDGADQAATPATAGEVVYRYNTITVVAEGYRNYDLTLSAMLGSGSELHGKNNPHATITGVGSNVAPNNFDDNKWGYAITTNTATDGSALTYSSVPDYGGITATLASKTKLGGQATADAYKLAFAAKFGADAPSDNYQGHLIVSVTGTPGVTVELNDITSMQEMTAEICTDTPAGQSKQLKDTRDNKIYWVTKLADSNCWMTQNLAYNGGGTARKYNDSNSCTGWVNTNTVAQYCAISHTDGDHTSHGNYYSWLAATNGDSSGTTTGQLQGICPNGWHLPASNTTEKGSFGSLTTAYGAGNNAAGSTIMHGNPMYFQYSGRVRSSGIDGVGSSGYYWSSTPYLHDGAYTLYLTSSLANPSDANAHYVGYSVRCIANF